MLSDRLSNLRVAIGAIGRYWSEDEFNTLIMTITSAIDDAEALEAQVVSETTRALPYPDNVINIAAILHRKGVTVGIPAATSDEGGAA